jgi:amino acid adenylation domain-containing protein
LGSTQRAVPRVLLAAGGEVLGLEPDGLAGQASFAMLGGTSLRALELAARARTAGFSLDLPRLLGPERFAEVLAAASPAEPEPEPVPAGPALSRPATALELHMLLGEETGTPQAWHLLFSAEIRGPLDQERLRRAIQAVVDRHEALRTVFGHSDEGLRARVVPRARARLYVSSLPLAEGRRGIDVLHTMLRGSSAGLLAPFEAPPLVFWLHRVDERRHVLSVRIHHVIADGWSIGMLWREIFDHYADPDAQRPPAAAPPAAAADEEAVGRRIAELAGVPTVFEPVFDRPRPAAFDHLGVRLPFELDEPTREACERLARSCGVTRNTVLLAAWGLVLARRAGLARFLIGMSWIGRPTERSREAIGLATTLLPVLHDSTGTDTVRELLESTAGHVLHALRGAEVPFARLAQGLGADRDPTRPTLVQAAFAAHDEMVPEHLAVSGLDVALYEGHCGGAVFDSLLYVQRWDRSATLCLEYASSVYSEQDAAELIADYLRVLTELVRDPRGEFALDALSPADRPAIGPQPRRKAPDGLWQLFEQVAESRPEEIALDEPGKPALSYGELRRAAEAQAAELHRRGVRVGDRVVLAVPRSAREIAAVLGVLRCGAAYIGLEPGVPAEFLGRMVEIARPVIAVVDPERAAQADELAAFVPCVAPVDPWAPPAARQLPAPAGPDPERVAYIAFTSGSTGAPKAVRIPQRGVLRLVDGSGIVLPEAARRFLRFAPLSFDASTLEIFAPLAEGGTITFLPDRYPAPADLAAFIERRQVTGLWLTAGLFRVVADHAPGAFRGVRQLLTGGDTVPAAQVRTVLEHCPGLRVTNGYGPTENTTFTTVHHVEDATELGRTVPIGRPIAGTGVLVADDRGRAVARGAVGELLTSGLGLALDYAGDAAETGRRFVLAPDGVRYYRTGDLARWDGRGELRILGRRDRQVKIRGFRVELDAVGAVLRSLPGVADAVAVASAEDGEERRVVAGLVADAATLDLARVRAAAEAGLPHYALPALWAVLPELPLTGNGKVDAAALTKAALGAAAPDRSAPHPAHAAAPDRSAPQLEELEDRIAEIWEEVLATDDFGYEDRFFDIGGTSLQIPAVRERLSSAYPGCEVRLVDLFAHTSVAELAAFVHGRIAGAA